MSLDVFSKINASKVNQIWQNSNSFVWSISQVYPQSQKSV